MASSGPSSSPGNGIATPGSDSHVPWAFIDCPTDTLIVLISHMLNLLMQHNDQVVLTPDALTRFHSRAAPGISVLEYLRRIVKYTNMEKIPLLSLLAYIDITCQHLPTFTLSSLTVHRFLIAGVCAGSKAQCDVFCTNAHYAKVGGIKVQELNALEREFLKVTQWNLCCNADLLQRYYTSLIKSHGGYTQAPPPTTSPFQPFPRSLSKPPPEEDEEMADESDEGGKEANDAEVAPEEGDEPESSKRRSMDVTDMIVDTNGDSSAGVSPHASTTRRLSRTELLTGGEGMDVDPPAEEEEDQSPLSAATSSIPSSSRSSARGSSRGRGRAASLSYSDARPAEPQLDRTTASGSPFKSQRESISRSPLNRQAVHPQDHPPDHSNDHPFHEHDDHHDHHHGHHHGLLKNLVGGLFHRRKSHHTDHPPMPAPPSVGHHAPTTTNGNHQVIPSRPLGSNSHQPNSAHHPTTSNVPTASFPGISRNGSATRSPRGANTPGLAKPVTPRIRTREEVNELGAVNLKVAKAGTEGAS